MILSFLITEKINPADSKNIYLLNSTWGNAGGIYKSDDSGSTWRYISDDMPESWLKTSKRMNDLAISSTDPNRIYAGSSRYIYTSKDYGKTWEQKISKYKENGWTHTGINVFGQTRKVLPSLSDKNELYIATADHGLLASTNNGTSWNESLPDESMARNIWDLSMCNTKPHTLHAVVSSSKSQLCTMKYTNKNWTKSCNHFEKSARYEKISVSPHDCSIVYLALNKNFYRSNDGGMTWKPQIIGTNNNKINVIEFDTLNPERVYLGTSNGLYLSNDNGTNWLKLNTGTATHITAIYNSTSINKRLVIGTKQTNKARGGILISTDEGKTWHTTLDNIVKYVTAISKVYGIDNTLVAATMDHNYHDISDGSGIFISYNAGNTWEDISQDLPVKRGYNVTTSANHPLQAYLSTAGSGAYRLTLQP